MRALAWTRTQQKTGSAAVPQSPDFRVMRSVAEEQPQQNDHRNRHAKQPKQNSSSHHFLLMHRGENARSRGQFLRGKERGEGTFYDFGISESDNPIRNSE